jgi:hypothetical protein
MEKKEPICEINIHQNTYVNGERCLRVEMLISPSAIDVAIYRLQRERDRLDDQQEKEFKALADQIAEATAKANATDTAKADELFINKLASLVVDKLKQEPTS